MKKEKKPKTDIKISFGWLDELVPKLKELSQKEGIQKMKTGSGKEFVFSSSFKVGPEKKETTTKVPKKTVKPDTKEREPLVDVFDEKKHLKIVAELPGIEKKDIRINVKNKTLVITTKNKKFHKELALPSKVKSKAEWTYNNGVLEIKLKK